MGYKHHLISALVMSLALVATLAGCASAPAAESPTASIERDPNAPRGAIPKLTMLAPSPPLGDGWFEGWLSWTGFPAVSEDGTVIINARRLHDGARGLPNLRVEAFAVSDGHPMFESVIIDAGRDVDDDALEGQLSGPQLEQIRADFDKARRYLAGRRWHTLTPLTTPIVEAELDDSVPYFTADGAVAVVLNEPELIVDLASESRTFVRNVSAWSASPNRDQCPVASPEDPNPEPAPDEDCVCYNPSGVANAWSDVARGVIVIEVGYVGTDSCWEPDTRLLPMRLPTPKNSQGWRRGARSADVLAFARDQGDLVSSIESDEERDALRTYLTHWQRRFPDAPNVKAARRLLDP